ncbi:MAG: MDR family oxidoreductase [Rhodospirillales bacterium]
MSFKALVLDEADGKVAASIRTLEEAALPDGDVDIDVECSTLNYKDGLILNGIGRLVRKYPHVPGIDMAGTVTRAAAGGFKPGDKVVLTGWRVGEAHWGGYAQKARVKAEWLVRLPDGLTARRAMAIGTAGFTAMLCVMALEDAGLKPGAGEVLVTGANGGVGGVGIALLARLGHTVVAATRRKEMADHLKALGASAVIDPAEVGAPPGRPLASERWAGVLDAVGGPVLASALAAVRYNAAVAACGNAAGNDLATTVLPFILRGVKLLGVDSVMCPMDRRARAWQRLAAELPMDALDRLTRVAPLADLPALASQIIKGETSGRIVIDVNA